MEFKEIENKKSNIVKIKAKRRRKKMRVAAVLLAIFALLACVMWVLCCTVFFPIKTIAVKGNGVYTTEQIISASGVTVGDKLFGVSENRVEKAVTTTLPYVKTLQIKRNLFDSIEIKVTETYDVYCFNNNGVFYTTDADYKALKEFSQKPNGVTEIILTKQPEIKLGHEIEIDENSVDLIKQIMRIFNYSNLKIDYLNISNTSSITAGIENRFSVNLGSIENISGKTEHLCAMIKEINVKNGAESTGKIDLSVWTSQKREGYFEETANF
ncbi:MAG: FtsQ-type POTRA domain-containing protein [Clostridia bacterium]|nr:FtsQ-type POTRA domain-containing protein [Clostridia bacterium]